LQRARSLYEIDKLHFNAALTYGHRATAAAATVEGRRETDHYCEQNEVFGSASVLSHCAATHTFLLLIVFNPLSLFTRQPERNETTLAVVYAVITHLIVLRIDYGAECDYRYLPADHL
jgi:hypothetical protein